MPAPRTPFAGWTPAQDWLGIELARRILMGRLDRGPDRRATLAEDARARDPFVVVHVNDRDAISLEVVLSARHASLWLEPRVVDGARWRDDWVLELTRGDERWRLAPGEPPVQIPDARRGTLRGELLLQRRFLLLPAPTGEERVRLDDRAFYRHTRQSSAMPRDLAAPLAWSAATTPEPSPSWTLDLGQPTYLQDLRLDLLQVPHGAHLQLRAYAYPALDDGPPATCLSLALDPLPPPDAQGRTHLARALGWVARYVRLDLQGAAGESVVLRVGGCEVQGAVLWGDTLRESWRRALALHRDRVMVWREDEAGAFVPWLRFADIAERRLALSRALAARLEPAPSRLFVALATRNCVEWVLTDLAAVERGYVVVPLAPDEPSDRLRAILARCQPACLLVEARDADRLTELAREVCPSLRLVVVCDAESSLDAGGFPTVCFEALLDEGATATAPPAREPDEEDLYTLLFTSGSTGGPRGAMRSYRAFHAMIASYGVPQPAYHLSFQPLSHLSERMFLPAVLIHGGSVAFSRGAAHLRRELRAFAPTSLGSVPRLYDLLHAEFQRDVREASARDHQRPRHQIEADARARARRAFGDRLTVLSVGSAPVSPAVLEFLKQTFADLWVIEGYGTTESGTIASNGTIPAGVEVKLVPLPDAPPGDARPLSRGEIWVRTLHTISGYFGDEEASRAAIDDEGFFRTGDLGERTAAGIRVVGRVRSVVKLAQGEFVSAERVESALVTSPLVDRIFAHVEPGAAGVSVLLFPHPAALAELLQAPPAPLATLVAHPDAVARVLLALREHGRESGLGAHELPVGLVLEATLPTVEDGLLTSSGKLARSALAARHGARLVAALQPQDTDVADEPRADPLVARLVRVASALLGRQVSAREPLVEVLDSLAAAALLEALNDELGRAIALSAWFGSRTLADLAARLSPDDAGAPATRSALADEVARELARPPVCGPLSRASSPLRSVLLTGATGFLGVHLLEELLATELTITCVVRAKDDAAARERLASSLRRFAVPAVLGERVRVVAGDLTVPSLGLSSERFSTLARSVEAVLHAGAVVSWLSPYAALRGANVEGTRTMIELAARGAPASFHLVSTISTAPADGDERSRLSTGQILQTSPYALSKWLSEHHALAAAEQGLALGLYRPAMIAPHSQRGVGNPEDFLQRYLIGCAQLGLFLDLPDERLDMTPVDFVSRAIVALLRAQPHGGDTHHLVNVAQSPSYAALGRAMRAAGLEVRPADYGTFRRALVAHSRPPADRAWALGALLSYFPAEGFALSMGPWPCRRTRDRLAALGVRCPEIDAGMIRRQVEVLRERGRL